jgi:UDPglucose 6-dehydrogenase
VKIGLCGLGWVGGTMRAYFAQTEHQMFLYDKFKGIGSVAELNQADVIFVAVPTPFAEGGYDDSAVRSALGFIADGKVVVLKSTVMPGSTERFQKQYPQKTILFNPEFLTEKNANEDFCHPERQLIGYADWRGKEVAQLILSVLPYAPYSRIMLATEAEMVKYFSNVFLAARVTFANQMFDICQAAGVNYTRVKDAAAQDSRIGASHFDVFDNDYRGYGGHCLPKDTRALIEFAKSPGGPTSVARCQPHLTGCARIAPSKCCLVAGTA